MYGMTAAHKTLPLPAYVRVTNLQNGRSVVVRVNDRGPFVGNRIIDLSYTAAAKLDMLRNGTAMVEVRAIDPCPTPAGRPRPPTGTCRPPPLRRPRVCSCRPAPSPTPRMRSGWPRRLRGGGYGKVFVRDDLIAGRKMYRVRIGPVPDVAEFDRIVAALERAGVQRCASRARLSIRCRRRAIRHCWYISPALLTKVFVHHVSSPCCAFSCVSRPPLCTDVRRRPRRRFRRRPQVDARAYIVVDYRTDKMLAAQEATARMEPASLTKLMTAYIVFRNWRPASSSWTSP